MVTWVLEGIFETDSSVFQRLTPQPYVQSKKRYIADTCSVAGDSLHFLERPGSVGLCYLSSLGQGMIVREMIVSHKGEHIVEKAQGRLERKKARF